MKEPTINQKNVLKCLTHSWSKLNGICDKYAKIQSSLGYNSNGYVWKSEVSRILNSLIKYRYVDWNKGGYYKLLPEDKK